MQKVDIIAMQNSFDVIEHAAMPEGAFFVDKIKRKLYCRCIYQVAFKLFDFDTALDASINIANSRVSEAIEAKVRTLEAISAIKNNRPLPIEVKI